MPVPRRDRLVHDPFAPADHDPVAHRVPEERAPRDRSLEGDAVAGLSRPPEREALGADAEPDLRAWRGPDALGKIGGELLVRQAHAHAAIANVRHLPGTRFTAPMKSAMKAVRGW